MFPIDALLYDPEDRRRRLGRVPRFSLVSKTPFAPVSLADVTLSLKLPESLPVANEEAPGIDASGDLQGLIEGATEVIEGYLGYSILGKTWDQTQDQVFGREVWLLKTPVQAIVSAKYIPSWQDDTALTIGPGTYVLSGEKLIFRGGASLPTTRDADGFTIRYTAGSIVVPSAAVPDPSLPNGGYTEAEMLSVRKRVKPNIKRAILQFLGHLYDNPEGRPIDVQTFSEEGKQSALPPNVVALLSSSRNWSLTGRSGNTWGN